jgi:hypothetical protein
MSVRAFSLVTFDFPTRSNLHRTKAIHARAL